MAHYPGFSSRFSSSAPPHWKWPKLRVSLLLKPVAEQSRGEKGAGGRKGNGRMGELSGLTNTIRLPSFASWKGKAEFPNTNLRTRHLSRGRPRLKTVSWTCRGFLTGLIFWPGNWKRFSCCFTTALYYSYQLCCVSCAIIFQSCIFSWALRYSKNFSERVLFSIISIFNSARHRQVQGYFI